MERCGCVHGRFAPHVGGFAWNRLALLIIGEGHVDQPCPFLFHGIAGGRSVELVRDTQKQTCMHEDGG